MRIALTTLLALIAAAASRAQDDSLAVARAIVRVAAPPTDDTDATVREALAAAQRAARHPAAAVLGAFAKWRAPQSLDLWKQGCAVRQTKRLRTRSIAF